MVEPSDIKGAVALLPPHDAAHGLLTEKFCVLIDCDPKCAAEGRFRRGGAAAGALKAEAKVLSRANVRCSFCFWRWRPETLRTLGMTHYLLEGVRLCNCRPDTPARALQDFFRIYYITCEHSGGECIAACHSLIWNESVSPVWTKHGWILMNSPDWICWIYTVYEKYVLSINACDGAARTCRFAGDV